MSNSIILIIILVVVGIVALLYFKNKGSAPIEDSAEKQLAQISPEERELFELGLHPEKAPHTFIYALTTCTHCKKTRLLLEGNKVPFSIIYIDSYPKVLNQQLSDKVKEYNPRGSFPTIRLTNGQIITGYRENSLKEALINDPERTTTVS